MIDYDDVQNSDPQIQHNRNPSFEAGGGPDDVWSGWAEAVYSGEGFGKDDGQLMVSFKIEPERELPSLVGSAPIYVDGWTSVTMARSASGVGHIYVNSRKRPWWAVGLLYRLWCRYMESWAKQ